MLFHAVRDYNLKNILMNRTILQSKEKKYKLNKKKKPNSYLIR